MLVRERQQVMSSASPDGICTGYEPDGTRTQCLHSLSWRESCLSLSLSQARETKGERETTDYELHLTRWYLHRLRARCHLFAGERERGERDTRGYEHLQETSERQTTGYEPLREKGERDTTGCEPLIETGERGRRGYELCLARWHLLSVFATLTCECHTEDNDSRCFALSLARSLSRCASRSLALALSLSHTHSLSLSHTHTLSLSLSQVCKVFTSTCTGHSRRVLTCTGNCCSPMRTNHFHAWDHFQACGQGKDLSSSVLLSSLEFSDTKVYEP